MPVDAVVAIEAGELHFPVFAAAIFMRDGEVVHTDDPPRPNASLGIRTRSK